MVFLPRAQSETWLRAAGVDRRDILAAERHFPIDPDSGVKAALAKLLVRTSPLGSGLFFIEEFGVWPSSENMEIFNGYRRSLGEMRSLGETPGHLFGAGELDQVEALLCLSLYFCWDTLLVSSDSTVAILTSHDEIVAVAESHPLRPIQNALANFRSVAE